MNGYRRLWWATLVTAGIPSALLGMAFSPTPFVVATIAVLGLAVGIHLVAGNDVGRRGRDLCGATILLVASGPVLGGATLGFLILGIATSPTVVGAFSRKLATPLPVVMEESPVSDAVASGMCLRALDGRALCDAWGASFVQLKSASTLNERLAVTAVRARLLDEIERRSSDGFAAWLAGSPSPASEPRWIDSSSKDDPP